MTRKVIAFHDWRVQRFKDGKPLTTELVRGATAADAAARVCGKRLVTEGEAGKHVARVRAVRSGDWVYFYRPAKR